MFKFRYVLDLFGVLCMFWGFRSWYSIVGGRYMENCILKYFWVIVNWKFMDYFLRKKKK